MSVGEEFSENDQIFTSKPEDRLDISKLEKYLNDFGPERTRGYFDALVHIYDGVLEATCKDVETGVPHAPKTAVKNIDQLFSKYGQLMYEMAKLLKKADQPAATPDDRIIKPQ